MPALFNSTLDLRLPVNPLTTDPELYKELEIVYNAIRQIQVQIDAFLDIPPTQKTADYTFSVTDRGRGIDTTANVTVPLDSGADFSLGMVVTISNVSSTAISIFSTSGVSVIFAGAGTTGTRTLAAYGVATLRYLGANVWIIFGVGLA